MLDANSSEYPYKVDIKTFYISIIFMSSSKAFTPNT